MKINRDWHAEHPMPKNATIEQRLHWHLAHSANCACREMPLSIRKELEARGWVTPTVRSLR